MITFGELFAGIGGFGLGFERAGMTCKWQVEIDEFCRRILRQHWSDNRQHGDVQTFPEGTTAVDLWVNVIAGGFPCQDVSNAGKRDGIGGGRSGLWSEFVRILRVFRPDVAVIENTAGLAVRGMRRVLGDLAGIGFDAEWEMLPAAAFGAVHRRERSFIVAYPAGNGLEGGLLRPGEGQTSASALDRRRHWPSLSGPLGLRSADGLSGGLDELTLRINALGNAVCPQVAEWIGKRIVKFLNRTES